jgi:hypothetical protein
VQPASFAPRIKSSPLKKLAMQRILSGRVDFAIMFNLIFLLKLLDLISEQQKRHFVWDGQILWEIFLE